MYDFNRSNKVSGVHWLKKSAENIQIILRLKPLDGILSLPKYEDYANESNSTNLHLEAKADEYILKWQEKVFSSWELQRYSESHNCLTNIELNYHDMLKNENHEPSKVHTYIHDDYYLPLPLSGLKRNETKFCSLSSCLDKMHINERVGNFLVEESGSMGHLFRSEENLDTEEQWTAMHVVFDNSTYGEDNQLIIKQEALLLSLYHNRTLNYLIITPDANNLDLNPYIMETDMGMQLGYKYALDMWFDEEANNDELLDLLQKLYKKWEKRQKQLIDFTMPPLGKRQHYVTIEILTAENFDMDNLYIEFDVKVPKEVQCTNILHGRSHISESVRVNDTKKWNFGHNIELNLEMDDKLEATPIQLFFEVISIDSWCRHRTEGYSYLSLPLEPGYYSKQLSCSRPEELDVVEAESRRFFVGGCHLLKDLNVLAKPQLQDTTFKFTGTGFIALRWSVITQAHLPGNTMPSLPSTTSASSLLLGAEAVLRKYKKARARLAAATKDLPENMVASGDG